MPKQYEKHIEVIFIEMGKVKDTTKLLKLKMHKKKTSIIQIRQIMFRKI